MRVKQVAVVAAVLVVVGFGIAIWNGVQRTRAFQVENWLRMLAKAVMIRSLYVERDPLVLPDGDINALRQWMDASGDVAWRGLTTGGDTRLPLVDYWGQAFVYRYPPRRKGALFELYSIGPNGVDEQGEGDDITCGDAAEFSSYSPAFKEGIVDVEWIRSQKGHLQRERQSGKIIGAPPSRFNSDSGQVPVTGQR